MILTLPAVVAHVLFRVLSALVAPASIASRFMYAEIFIVYPF